MDDDLPVERSRKGGREEAIELAASGPAPETGRDENRLALVRDAEVPQLLDGGADGRSPRVDRRAGQRQRRHVGHDRRPPSAWTTPASGGPESGKRRASRTAAPTSVIAWRSRLGRHEHDGVVGSVDDEEPRPREERDAHGPHTRLGT